MLVLIYGITGLVGQATARAALEAGHQVRGLARSPDKLPADLSEKLEGFTKMTGVDDLTAFDKACIGVDAVISAPIALPETVVVAQIHLLRAAEKAGVKIFHGASWNIDWSNMPLGYAEPYDPLIIFYHYARLTSPLKLIFGFTGAILDYMFFHDEKFGPLFRKDTKTATFLADGNYICTCTTVNDLAAYAVQAISDPDSTHDGNYFVASFQTTFSDMLKTYEKSRGVKLTVETTFNYKEAEKQLSEAREKIPRHRHQEYIPLAYTRMVSKKDAFATDPVHSRIWSHIKPTSWEQFLEEHPEI